MLDLFKGRTIKVRPVVFGDPDAFGNPVKDYDEPVEVADVLIAPGNPEGDIEDGRPYGAVVSFTLYVPKGIDVEFRGAQVEIDGEVFEVLGDPRPYPPELVLGPRNLVVKLARYEG